MIPQNGESTPCDPVPGHLGRRLAHPDADGRRIRPPGPPYHLYMSVNDALHYDVSKGTAIEFVGMTQGRLERHLHQRRKTDGQRYRQQHRPLSLERVDRHADPALGRQRQREHRRMQRHLDRRLRGRGAENRTALGRWSAKSHSATPNVPYFQAPALDDVTAENSGDVYFFSPEQLDGSKFGIPNSRNLYVARSTGRVQFVATLGTRHGSQPDDDLAGTANSPRS